MNSGEERWKVAERSSSKDRYRLSYSLLMSGPQLVDELTSACHMRNNGGSSSSMPVGFQAEAENCEMLQGFAAARMIVIAAAAAAVAGEWEGCVSFPKPKISGHFASKQMKCRSPVQDGW